MDTEQKISEVGLRHSAAVLHPAGTVMLCRTASVGLICMIGKPMATTQAFVTWTPGPRLDARYLMYVLHAMKPEWERLAYGSTHMTIYMPDLESLVVPICALGQQGAIADFLDRETARIDALITAKRRMIVLADEKFRASQVEILTGRRAEPSDATAPPRAMKGWPGLRAKHCTDAITVGVVVDPSSYFVDEGVPFIHGTDVREGYIETGAIKFLAAESNELLVKSQVKTGDVVAMRVGYPGRAAVVPPSLDRANCASVLIFRTSKTLHPTILMEFLNSRLGRMQIESVQYGAAQGVMNVGDAVNLVVPVPPLEEQASVVEGLRAARAHMNDLTSTLNAQISLLAERRQALITAAVTGQIEIPGVAA